MKVRTDHALYIGLFLIAAVVFALISSRTLRDHGDAISAALITGFAVVIIHFDFRRKLGRWDLAKTTAALVALNAALLLLLYVVGAPSLGGYLIIFFIIEGAIVYWLLERKVSHSHEK